MPRFGLQSAVIPILALAVAWAPAPVLGGPEVSVQLRTDIARQRQTEKVMKALLDELAGPALDVSFKATSVSSLDAVDQVTVYLTGFHLAIAPGWYRRYRDFHARLIREPFAAEAQRHAATYCLGRHGLLRATALGPAGKVLYVGEVRYIQSVARCRDMQRFLFDVFSTKVLPDKPPLLPYLDRSSPDRGPFTIVPAAIAGQVTRFRISDPPLQPWPVALDPPQKPVIPKIPGLLPSPRTSPGSAPSGASSPSATPRVTPPRLDPPRLSPARNDTPPPPEPTPIPLPL